METDPLLFRSKALRPVWTTNMPVDRETPMKTNTNIAVVITCEKIANVM